MRVLGLMSGTSLDGVDAAMIETDGESISAFGPARTMPYQQDERAILEAAVAQALQVSFDPRNRLTFLKAEAVILQTHARLVRELIREGVVIDLVGFHGQTVLHRPEQKRTLQIGNPAALAETLNLPVIADLRIRDLLEGGQGAPLVPIYHAALARKLGLERPLAFLNLGGVSNVTWIGEGGELRAFDIGPGNGLMDQLVAAHDLGTFDVDGRLAQAGRPHEDIVNLLMQHPFFSQAGPKSLDRYDFSLEPVRHLSVEDGAATLAAFSAQAVAASIKLLPAPPSFWILCGGGRHNLALVAQLEARAGRCILADDLGLRGDFVEAEAIAYLAVRSRLALPITFPNTTGVSRPITGGTLYCPSSGAGPPGNKVA
jgi:anhydro-N-acetylmuramic acid kinase